MNPNKMNFRKYGNIKVPSDWNLLSVESNGVFVLMSDDYKRSSDEKNQKELEEIINEIGLFWEVTPNGMIYYFDKHPTYFGGYFKESSYSLKEIVEKYDSLTSFVKTIDSLYPIPLNINNLAGGSKRIKKKHPGLFFLSLFSKLIPAKILPLDVEVLLKPRLYFNYVENKNGAKRTIRVSPLFAPEKKIIIGEQIPDLSASGIWDYRSTDNYHRIDPFLLQHLFDPGFFASYYTEKSFIELSKPYYNMKDVEVGYAFEK